MLALVVLIVAITDAMVRWFLMRPMKRVVERLRRSAHRPGGRRQSRTEPLSNLAREVETMAESLIAARPAAAAEARLREAGESTGGRPSGWRCTCAIAPDRAGSLWCRTASRTCTCARDAKRCAWCRRAAGHGA